MASLAVYNILSQYLAENWDSTRIVEVENASIDLNNIEDVDDVQTEIKALVAVEYHMYSFSRPASIGAPLANWERESGDIYIHVLAPAGTGTTELLGYAEELKNLFLNKTIDGVWIRRCIPPVYQNEGSHTYTASRGNWFGFTIELQYQYDYIPS